MGWTESIQRSRAALKWLDERYEKNLEALNDLYVKWPGDVLSFQREEERLRQLSTMFVALIEQERERLRNARRCVERDRLEEQRSADAHASSLIRRDGKRSELPVKSIEDVPEAPMRLINETVDRTARSLVSHNYRMFGRKHSRRYEGY